MFTSLYKLKKWKSWGQLENGFQYSNQFDNEVECKRIQNKHPRFSECQNSISSKENKKDPETMLQFHD